MGVYLLFTSHIHHGAYTQGEMDLLLIVEILHHLLYI